MARLFLSGRFHEFVDLRSRICSRVSEQPDLQIVNLDDARAVSESALARSLAGVHDCDCLILLLGESYSEGTRPSVTEREYDLALELGTPVLAFARPETEMVDADAHAFLRKVRETVVVGRLSSRSWSKIDDDTENVIQSIRLAMGGLDEEIAHSSSSAVLAELAALGLTGMERPKLAPGSRTGPDLERAIEQRAYAVEALMRGDPADAIVRISQAVGLGTHDWATAYLFARLAEIRGYRSELERARADLRRAAPKVGYLDHAPLRFAATDLAPDPDEDWASAARRREAAATRARTERTVATETLLARLSRRLGDYGDALDRATAAVKLQHFAQRALTEVVLAHAGLGNREGAARAAYQLMALYPEAAHQVLALLQDRKLRLHVERQLIAKVQARHAGAIGYLPVRESLATGELAPVFVPAADSLLQALGSYRAQWSGQREAVARHLSVIAEVVSNRSPTTRADAAARLLEAAHGQLDRATHDVERQYGNAVAAAQSLGYRPQEDGPITSWADAHISSVSASLATVTEQADTTRIPSHIAWRWARNLLVLWVAAGMINELLSNAGQWARGIALIAFVVAFLAALGTAYVCLRNAAHLVQKRRTVSLAQRRARLQGESQTCDQLTRILDGWREAGARLETARSTVQQATEAHLRARRLDQDALARVGLPEMSVAELSELVRTIKQRFDAAFFEQPRWADARARSVAAAGTGTRVYVREPDPRRDIGLRRGERNRFMWLRPDGRLSDLEYFDNRPGSPLVRLEAVLQQTGR